MSDCLPASSHQTSLLLSTYHIAVILDPKKRKSVIASTFLPSICHEVIEYHDLSFLKYWFFKPTFSLSVDSDCSHEIRRWLLLGRKVMTNPNSVLESKDITLLTKVHIVKAMVFSSSLARVSELDHKEGRAPKNWCFQTVVLEKTLEIPLDCKEIKPVNPKGNQPWILFGRTDAETPILCPPDVNS